MRGGGVEGGLRRVGAARRHQRIAEGTGAAAFCAAGAEAGGIAAPEQEQLLSRADDGAVAPTAALYLGAGSALGLALILSRRSAASTRARKSTSVR